MTSPSLRIASRRSQLAMVQTHWVRDSLLAAHPDLEISIEAMASWLRREAMRREGLVIRGRKGRRSCQQTSAA